MEHALYICAAVYLVQALAHEVSTRRYIRREWEYLKQIRSLENRIHAKDINTYVGLESEDAKNRQPPKKEKPVRERVPAEDRSFSGNGIYDDPEGA